MRYLILLAHLDTLHRISTPHNFSEAAKLTSLRVIMPRHISQWFLTYPRNDATPGELLDQLRLIDEVIDYVVAREAHADGGNHLHAYVKFVDGPFLKDAPNVFNVLSSRGNYQPARSAKAVIKYCTKGDNYISSFDISSYVNKKGKVNAALVKSKTTRQAFEDGDIGIHALKQYQFARQVLSDPYSHDDVRGIWIYGAPGIGKSHSVRALHPDLYIKPQSKWWDGYDGHKIVLLDDFDAKDIFGHYLKIWADKYHFEAEIKNGITNPVYTHFYITSNYKIEELFSDPVTVSAIKRRFRVIHFRVRGQDLGAPPLFPVFPPAMDPNIAN